MENEPQQLENEDDNSDKLPENQRSIIDLTLGKRSPANENERQLLQQIREMERKGIMVDMPFD